MMLNLMNFGMKMSTLQFEVEGNVKGPESDFHPNCGLNTASI